jgi:putative addiction module component (TIGR02574 family)
VNATNFIHGLLARKVLKTKFVTNRIMNTSAIRQKLHNYLEVADDKKVKAIYAIMKNEIEESAVDYTDEFKAELDRRYADYKSGKAKMITEAQSKRRIQKILKSVRKK